MRVLASQLRRDDIIPNGDANMRGVFVLTTERGYHGKTIVHINPGLIPLNDKRLKGITHRYVYDTNDTVEIMREVTTPQRVKVPRPGVALLDAAISQLETVS